MAFRFGNGVHPRRLLRYRTRLSCAHTERVYQGADRRTALFLSPVWCEPSSSAAGVRTAALIKALQAAGWKVSYLSPSKQNRNSEDLIKQGCSVFCCPVNDEVQFSEAVAQCNPALCIFDRFLAEEFFSFRVKELVPEALRVVDLQDLHFLRRGREGVSRDGQTLSATLQHRPGPTNDTLRELASIHRSDLALVCSPVELEMLQSCYQVPAEKLQLAPLFVQPSAVAQMPPFSARQHFMTIGNFRHAPNMDAVQWLADGLWEEIRTRVPAGTELHVYGAYGNIKAVESLHKPEQGIHMKGHAPTLEIMQHYRACLAPLRFGAGLKGKIVDSWLHGMPVVTTPIGAEGMLDAGAAQWGGLWQSETASQFAEDAALLYSDEQAWGKCRANGEQLLWHLYDGPTHLRSVLAKIEDSIQTMEQRRKMDFIGNMLWMQQFRATEYFSRWIELKEKL